MFALSVIAAGYIKRAKFKAISTMFALSVIAAGYIRRAKFKAISTMFALSVIAAGYTKRAKCCSRIGEEIWSRKGYSAEGTQMV
jgi:phosphatidylglycerophosphate synthase